VCSNFLLSVSCLTDSMQFQIWLAAGVGRLAVCQPRPLAKYFMRVTVCEHLYLSFLMLINSLF
jgi:hypothetical protein